MNRNSTVNVISWAGIILIILDWIDIVPSAVGWIGFVTVIACFVYQVVQNRRLRR